MYVDPMEHELLNISNNEVQDNDYISSLEADELEERFNYCYV